MSRAIWESKNPYKNIAEKGFLLFTPVWCTVVGIIMVGGWAKQSGDFELMTLGVSMAAGTLLCAIFVAQHECKKRQFTKKQAGYTARTVINLFLGIFALSFAANFLQTEYFFSILKMSYGFPVTWRVDLARSSIAYRNPIFLYFLTVPYFATYMSGGMMMFRAARRVFPRLPQSVVTFVIATLLAFLETATNANNLATNVFCYEDHLFALTFGSFMYGIMFIFAVPVWLHYGGVPEFVPEVADPSFGVEATHSVVMNLAVAVADWAMLAFVVRPFLAPLLVKVEDGRGPFGACLTP